MDHPPVVSSASREPTKRPWPIPAKVKAAISLMVRGCDDDPNTQPLNLVDAARAAGVTPYVLRRYFDRPVVIAYLRAARRAFRNELCAANEACLRDIRNTAVVNTMARVAAIRQLELIDEADAVHARVQDESPGVVIQIIAAPKPASEPAKIDAMPPMLDAAGRKVDAVGNPVFDPHR
jgi:hypothetical protein